MQLDIFNDSRDVMLRNDVLSALQQYDAAGARRALHALENEYPEDEALVQLGLIADALEARSTAPFERHQAVLDARHLLSQDLQPAVSRLFPRADSARWLAPLWAELAGRAAVLPFRADQADAHSASLFLLATSWAEAEDALLRIASWRRIPAPLSWTRRNAPERALKLVLELLSLERQGRHHELLQTRRELQSLSAAVYAAYMKTR
jgi:hypothetical protein